MLQIFERIGRQVQALACPSGAQFDVGVRAGELHPRRRAARTPRTPACSSRDADRADFLDAVSTQWEELDPDEYPFTRTVADQLREHDDREQFLAGIDLILAGITTVHPARG